MSVPECRDLLTPLHALLEMRTMHYNQVLQSRQAGAVDHADRRQAGGYDGGHSETFMDLLLPGCETD